MEHHSSEARVQLKQKLLNLLKAAPAAGIVLASTTLSVPTAQANLTRIQGSLTQGRLSIEERVAKVRTETPSPSHPGLMLPSSGQNSPETLLAWGNWHNWHNGWHNGWHNWHNWQNW
jgi:hypothetical protein